MAWLLRRSRLIVASPGTKSLDHVKNNLRATDVASELTDDEVQALTAVQDEGAAKFSTMSPQMINALQRRRQAS